MVPLPSEYWERKMKYPAPMGGQGGEAPYLPGLP